MFSNLVRHRASEYHRGRGVITVTMDMDDDADVELAHQPGVRFLHLTSRRVGLPEMVRCYGLDGGLLVPYILIQLFCSARLLKSGEDVAFVFPCRAQ